VSKRPVAKEHKHDPRKVNDRPKGGSQVTGRTDKNDPFVPTGRALPVRKTIIVGDAEKRILKKRKSIIGGSKSPISGKEGAQYLG